MPRGLQEIKVASFQHNRHVKVVRFSALGTDRLYIPGNIPGTHSFERLSRPQGHIVAGRIVSIKNSSGIIGNRTRDVPAYSTVRQPTTPTQALLYYLQYIYQNCP
jgi:hypothetical protein